MFGCVKFRRHGLMSPRYGRRIVSFPRIDGTNTSDDERWSQGFPRLEKLLHRGWEKMKRLSSRALTVHRSTPRLSPPCLSMRQSMAAPHQDSEPPVATASRWVSRITTISLEMALPAGLGAWLDRSWGTSPWMVVLGAALGLYAAGASLMQIVRQQESLARSSPPRPQTTPQTPTELHNAERPDEPGSTT